VSTPDRIPPELKAEIRQIEAAKKNSAHFGPLYDKYYKQIFLFIYKRASDQELTGDLTSQVFLKALMNLKRYEYRGFPFSSWLYRIATNEINMYFRGLKKQHTVELRESDVVDLMHELEEGQEENEERQDQMVAALGEMAIENVQLIELRFFEKLSFREIGEVFDITEANAKVRVYRVLGKLKKLITLKGGQS